MGATAHAMTDPLARGTALPGNHTLEGVIGHGRIKSVYAATDAEGRKVAALVLHNDLVDELGEWFENAGILGRTLDHPGIVKTLAVGEVEGRPVIVCERLVGETLAEILARSGSKLPFAEVARIITQLAAALDYLHERSPIIVHRAITPENVFLADPDGRVKLLEVGSHDRPRFTASRPQHRSPEDLAEVGELSPRADVFSLASLAYELLVGQPAFNGDANTVLDVARSGQRKRVSDVRPEVAARVDEVLLRAWSISPESRHQSAGAFARALSEALSERAEPPRHSQRVPAGSTPTDEAPTGRVRHKHLDDINPMGEFPTVKLVVSADGSVAVTPAVGQPQRPSSNAPGTRGPAAPRPSTQPARPSARAPVRPSAPAPQTPPASAETLDDADKEPTARELPRPASVGATHDEAKPGLDAVIVAVDPTPTAVVLTVPETFSPAPPAAPAPAPLAQAVPVPSVAPVPQPPPAPPAAPPTPPAPPAPRSKTPVADLLPPPVALAPVPPPAPEAPVRSVSPTIATPPKPAPPSPDVSQPSGWPVVRSDRPAPSDPARMPPGNLPNFAFADEPTEAIPIPSRSAGFRSPIVLAAAFLANAILIVGIAHALAWSARSTATPLVIQGPSPVCAPCAACPAAPVCPPAPVCAPPTAPLHPLPPPRPLSPLQGPVARPLGVPVRPATPPIARPPVARPPLARPAAPPVRPAPSRLAPAPTF